MSFATDLVVRSSAILLAGLVFSACLKRRSASLRHFVLAAATFATAAVVPMRLALPAWEVPVPSGLIRAVPDVVSTTRPVVAAAVPVTPGTPPSRVSLLAVAWLLGFMGSGTMLLAGVVRLRRIAARARPVDDVRWTGIAAAVASDLGIRRDVVILQTDAPDVLATWGIFRPRVLLPSHAREWSGARIRVVLSHELAHVRRADWFVQMTAEAIRTVCWFNPLAWMTCTRLRREAEQACDDAVLGRGVAAPEYAGHLLELARKCRRTRSAWASVPMANPSTLERRITAMLNPRLDRRPLSVPPMAALAVLLFGLTLPVAAMRQGPALLSGSIYDMSGAILPGVELTLEGANDTKTTAMSDPTGRFEFPNVQPGQYVLSAALPGFKALRQEFELRNARDWDRAVTLQLGELRESVTVRETRGATPAAAPQPSGGTPVRIGGNLRAPRKLLDVRPIYPAAMRAAGREAVVPLEAIIGRDGSVTSVRVVSAEMHPDFAIAAADAVRQWRFSPTLLNGVPVEVVMSVSITFSLSN